MNLRTKSTNRTSSRLRSLIAGVCAAAALAIATQAAALTSIGPGAFSISATTLTFEDLPGDNSALPTYRGVTLNGGAIQERYADYGSTLASVATTAGLGNVATTFGCNGACGTGFTLPSPEIRVGMYLSSNVDITGVVISAYKGGVLLGSQTAGVAADAIVFVGLEDAGGIDRIVIGNNTSCTGCIHQLDNIKFEGTAVPTASVEIPTVSHWSLIVLSGLLVLGTVVMLRRRRH
jgi:hypothetical protein